MLTMGSQEKQEALEMFLASCRAVAETRENPEFLRQCSTFRHERKRPESSRTAVRIRDGSGRPRKEGHP